MEGLWRDAPSLWKITYSFGSMYFSAEEPRNPFETNSRVVAEYTLLQISSTIVEMQILINSFIELRLYFWVWKIK